MTGARQFVTTADSEQSSDPVRFGAYICLSVPAAARRDLAGLAVPAIAERLGLRNEFDPGSDHPAEAVAYVRGTGVVAADIADPGLERADAVVHVASPEPGQVSEFCAELARLAGPVAEVRVLDGVVRPLVYTGTAMFNFAYAHRALQQSGSVMPNAFLIPMTKTAAWWDKDWMERHTYFLPRYDDSGRKLTDGHPLAAAAGIPGIMRRFYQNATMPAPPTEYDFITYFECSDHDIGTFQDVCAALRDVARNPEWAFVREGPTWRGRRVRTWAELFE